MSEEIPLGTIGFRVQDFGLPNSWEEPKTQNTTKHHCSGSIPSATVQETVGYCLPITGLFPSKQIQNLPREPNVP